MSQEKLLKYENAKLKHQFIFNLPVSKAICGRQCPGCYALKAQVRFPNVVLPYRQRRYAAALEDSFVSRITKEITSSKRTLTAVRIHESGEFFSQAYLNKWLAIAEACPNTRFYAFTKRLKDFDFSKFMAMKNVVIIDSLMHSAINYGSANSLLPNVFTCPCVGCGTTCKYCMTKQAQSEGIQFVAH